MLASRDRAQGERCAAHRVGFRLEHGIRLPVDGDHVAVVRGRRKVCHVEEQAGVQAAHVLLLVGILHRNGLDGDRRGGALPIGHRLAERLQDRLVERGKRICRHRSYAFLAYSIQGAARWSASPACAPGTSARLSTSGAAGTSAAASVTTYSARACAMVGVAAPHSVSPTPKNACTSMLTVFAFASLAQMRWTSIGAASSRSGGRATAGNCNSTCDPAAHVSRSALSVAELMRWRIGAVLPSGRPPSVVFCTTLAAMMTALAKSSGINPTFRFPYCSIMRIV